jgi:hypothetical protein
MTQVGPWTCEHCLKHQQPDLSNAVGHSCCGRCLEGLAHLEAAWPQAPYFPHEYSEGLVTPGVCSVCKLGPH